MKGLRASDWLDTKYPMHRVEVYLLEHPGAKIPGLPGMIQTLDQLARRADLDGRNSWPSLALMSERTGMSTRVITQHLSNLRRVGLIELDKSPSNPLYFQLRPDHRPPAYRLLYDDEFIGRVAAELAGRRLRTR